MRHFLLASASFAILCGPAFAGAPTPPSLPNVSPVSITVNTSTTATGGGSVTTTVHSGPLGLAGSLSVKASLLIASSQSVSVPGFNGGFTVP